MKVTHKLRVVSILALAVLCTGLLSGCNRGEENEPSQPTMAGVQDGQQTTIPDYEDGASSTDGSNEIVPPPDFGLTSPGDPNFSDMGSGQDEGMYTIEDGYAYALDPATFEKVGPPLDPVTHEVVTLTDTTDDTVPADTAVQPDDSNNEEETTTTPTQTQTQEPSKIPEDQKLPNTGIFLEDD